MRRLMSEKLISNHRETRRGESGFTLIELLIIVVILALLAAIVVFAVQDLTNESAIATCQSDFKTVESAAELFKAQVGAYPDGTTSSSYFGNASVAGYSGGLPGGLTPATASQGIVELMGTASVDGSTVGPWLKDYPYNASYYQIEVDANGSGTISVYNTASTPAPVPAVGATYTTADCKSVT
jgi:prepilin-type N-terminal cleavage/methylation domain-containing protein